MRGPALLGIGTAVPALRLSRAESVDAARTLCAEDDDQASLLENLYRQAGVESRHIVHTPDEFRRVVYGEGDAETVWVSEYKGDKGPSTAERMLRYEKDAPAIAESACRQAIAESGLSPDQFTHLVTVSCTGFVAPGVDIRLMKALGMRPTVERTNVGFMGCHGALNGLRVARGLFAAEPDAKILLCAIELCSLHYSYGWDPKKVVGNALFADGCGAVVLGAGGDEARLRLAASGACLFPDSEPAMAWHVRDHGFDMVLSSKVPNLIQANLRPWLSAWLDKQGLAIEGIRSWAIHPGGPRVLTGVQEALGLPAGSTDVSRMILERNGNMSSATVLFILKEMLSRGMTGPCVAIGFGPGLAAEVALFR